MELRQSQVDKQKENSLHYFADGSDLWTKPVLKNGRYKVTGLIAVGGFGCVFSALDGWNHDKKVVIKTPYYMGEYCRPFIARSQSAFEKQIKSLNKLYDREKRNLVGFSNAGFDSIVNLNDYFFDQSLDLARPFRNAAGVEYYVDEKLQKETPFLVMKHIRGVTLKDILPFNQVKTLRLAKQLLVLINYLHQPRKTKKGRPFYYLLCDLKAENILVTDEEQISLIDFGGVKFYWIDQKEIDLPVFVTDGYAAPEVYSGTLEFRDNPRIDNRFDIFTVGALMAQALTGQHPYQFFINYNPPQHHFDLDSFQNISKAVKKVIARATAHDRDKRYQSANEMLKDIRRALEKVQ